MCSLSYVNHLCVYVYIDRNVLSAGERESESELECCLSISSGDFV